MKIDTRRIRSVQVVEKPDGKYLRIGYAKRASRRAAGLRHLTGIGQIIKKCGSRIWANPIGRTITISATAAIVWVLIVNVLLLG